MSDLTILEEIRERRTEADLEWEDHRKEAKKDRQCVGGDPWTALDPDGLKSRRDAKRPAIAVDELGQYLNQTVNSERANPRGIKFSPTGNGANDAGAEFYENHVREIEYRSHAPMAYCTALDNAVTASYGWLRVTTKREHVRTFSHDLWIEPVVNADQVLPDPDAVWPDSRDMRYLFYLKPFTQREFNKRFPGARSNSFTGETVKLGGPWASTKQIQVAEYWTLDPVKRTLIAYRLPGERIPRMSLLDELPDGKLPEGVENLREEEVQDTQVKAWLTNGLELLEDLPWLGKYIPFVSCFGKILYVDDGSGSHRKLLSLTRLARDPYMLYCYLRTCEAEAVGAVSRSTWVGYEGQFAKPDEWAKANKEPVPYLQAKVTVMGAPAGEVLPLPIRQNWDPPLANVEAAAEAIRRAIQAAMGVMPLPTPMQQDNQKSGVALDKIATSYQTGSFHFKDNYNLMIERTGVIIEDLMDKYLDTARNVPVRLPNDEGSIVRINDPSGSEIGPNQTLSGDPIFTKGDYRVTISVGPSTDSQRQEAADFIDTMAGNIQVLAPVIGPQKVGALLAKMVKLKQLGPLGDEIVELLEPPKPMGQDGKPVPPELVAAQQQMQQMQQEIEKLQHVIEVDQVKMNGQKDIEGMKLQHQDAKAQLDSQTKLAVAGLTERVDRMAILLDHVSHARDLVHESTEGIKDRLHDVTVTHQEQRAALTMAAHARQTMPPPEEGLAGPAGQGEGE